MGGGRGDNVRMTPRAAELRQRLVAHLVDAGLLDDAWQACFAEVPRHAFIPDTVWRQSVTHGGRTGHGGATTAGCDGAGDAPATPVLEPVRRADDPAGWLATVYRDTHVVTQVDDGVPAGPGGCGLVATSSSSQPSVMAIMLRELDARPGHRVLEVGAGTGYNAALLAHRLGAAGVTTVDIDPRVASAASAALAAAGYPEVTVVLGDGERGHPPGAPYDRVVCTAGVRDVPREWVRQTRPGGRIVAPWSNHLFDGAVLTLTVDDDGRGATGRLGERVSFMPLRGQRPPHPAPVTAERATTRATGLHPDAVLREASALLAVSLRVPDCERAHGADGSLRLVDRSSGSSVSWAVVRPGTVAVTVEQAGPRRLWDEVELAHRWWNSAGRPGLDEWTITVGPAGQAFAVY